MTVAGICDGRSGGAVGPPADADDAGSPTMRAMTPPSIPAASRLCLTAGSPIDHTSKIFTYVNDIHVRVVRREYDDGRVIAMIQTADIVRRRTSRRDPGWIMKDDHGLHHFA
jgi:hypothetical protein